MSKARDRANRSGTDPVFISNSKLRDSSGNLFVQDASGNDVKLIAEELHLGDSAGGDLIIMKRSASGGHQFQNKASGSAAVDEGVGGVSAYATLNDLPTSAQDGDQALVISTGIMYIWKTSGWYKIATITNSEPSISSAGNASYAFALDGTPVSIEISATDPEVGTALQYRYQVSAGSMGSTAAVTSSATSGGTYSALAAGTLTSNKFFKVTPSTNAAHAGSFSLTFSASDGVNVATSSASAFTLVFETFGSTSLHLNAGPTEAGAAHIEVASHSDFTLGTNDFTIEGWFFSQGPSPSQDYPNTRVSYRTSVGYTPHLFDFRELDGAYSNKRAPMVDVGSGGVFRYHVTGSDRITSSAQFPNIENRWFHFAIVRNSGTTTMYVDGVSEGTWSDSTNYDELDKLWIGRHGYSANHNFTGWISNFRIVNGTAVYTSSFTPPTAPLTAIANTKLLICTKPDAVDDIGPTGHTVTKVGTATHATFNPFPWATTGYGSLFFDKSNDNLTYEAGGGNAVAGMTALSNLTVELWVYHYAGHSDSTTDPSIEEVYVHFTDNLHGGQQMTFGRYRTGSTTCPMYVSTHGNPWQNVVKTDNAAHDVNRGAWYHLAWVKEGTNIRMYKNGANVEGNNGTSSTNGLATLRVGEIHIGETSGASYDLLGYMSNLRISNNVRYTSDFTPSTTPFSNDSNTILLTCQHSAPDKTTDGAIHLNGGYVSTTANSDFTMGTGDFTIETWFKYTHSSTLSGNKYLVDLGSNGMRLTFSSGHIYANDGGQYIDWHLTNDITSIKTTKWYHLAFVRSGSNIYLYFDGVQKGTLGSSSHNHNTNTIRIGGYGGNGNYNWPGYISDFRIVKGKAVYTGAFSPPTGPLTKTGGTYPNNTNRTDPTAAETVLLVGTNSSSITDISDTPHTMTTAGGTVSATTGVQNIAPDASTNNFDLIANGDVHNAKYWPFGYNG